MVEKITSVYDMLAKEWGVEVAVNVDPLVSSVGVTDVIIAANNPRRLALVVVNLSANTIYAKPLTAASSTSGILLAANGGNLASVFRDDFILQAVEWHAIASGAGSSIIVIEVVIK